MNTQQFIAGALVVLAIWIALNVLVVYLLNRNKDPRKYWDE